MADPNHPVYPSVMSCGLSLREHMSIEFMKALMQMPLTDARQEGLLALADRAVEAAECLIARLNHDRFSGENL